MSTRLAITLSNGASFTLRPDMHTTYRSGESSQRTFWRYVCRAADRTIIATGSDLSSPAHVERIGNIYSKVQRDAKAAAVSLLGFAQHFADHDQDTTDDATGDSDRFAVWGRENYDEIMEWLMVNDPEMSA